MRSASGLFVGRLRVAETAQASPWALKAYFLLYRRGVPMTAIGKTYEIY